MVKIKVVGAIIPNDDKWIYDWFEMESTCPKDVESIVDSANGEEIEVEINSGGGSVFAGSEIYTRLRSYSGNVVTKIIGIAASAASIIAMAGNKVLISPTAEIMIHNVSSMAQGDYRDLAHEAQVIKDYNSTLANAYVAKSGMAKGDVLALMDSETWLTPQKALEMKFVDGIMFDTEGLKLVASFNKSQMLPQEVINKVRNSMEKKNTNPSVNQPDNEVDFLMLKNRLEIEKNRF